MSRSFWFSILFSLSFAAAYSAVAQDSLVERIEEAQVKAKFEASLGCDPDLEVRTGITEANQQGNLLIRIQPKPGTVAMLGIQQRIVPGTSNDDLGRRPMIAVLYVNSDVLKGLNTPAAVLELAAVLGNEYQQFKAWRDAPPELWSEFELARLKTRMTPNACRHQFERALVGYDYECHRLKEWGLQSTTGLQPSCEMVDDQRAFAQGILRFTEDSIFGEANPECRPYWVEIANRQ